MAPTAGTRLRMKHAHKKHHTRRKIKKSPSLKNKLRAVQRFLQRGNLDDATKKAKEDELASLEQQLKEKQQVEEEKQLVEKYKKPRFFERVKFMRKLKKAQKQLQQAKTEADRTKYSEQVDQLRRDLLYIYYYPKTEPYIALFPRTPHSAEQLARQQQLQEQAITRFEKDQQPQAFEKFCGDPLVQAGPGEDQDLAARSDDDDQHTHNEAEDQAPRTKPKAKLNVLAKLTKTNKRSKKPKRIAESHKQKSSTANKQNSKALVDQDEMDDQDDDQQPPQSNQQDSEQDQDEEDDFFLS